MNYFSFFALACHIYVPISLYSSTLFLISFDIGIVHHDAGAVRNVESWYSIPIKLPVIRVPIQAWFHTLQLFCILKGATCNISYEHEFWNVVHTRNSRGNRLHILLMGNY